MNRKTIRIVFVSATIITMFLGIMVITGWIIHNDFLREIFPGQVRMKFNVALGFTFSSLVLFLRFFGGENKICNNISIIFSIIIFLIGLLTLIEYISGYNLGIDELFIKDELRTTATYYAGRMSPLSAINFILIGTGLFFFNNEKTAIYQFFYLYYIAFAGALMLIGFNFISDIPTFIRLAIHVAVGFITLPMAIWFAQPVLHKNIGFELKLFTGFAAVFLLIVLISIFSSYYSNKRIQTSELVTHTNNVLSETEQILSLVKDIESGGRGYIITGDTGFLQHFTIAKDSLPGHISKLKELTKDNFQQQVRLDSLSALIDKRISFSSRLIEVRKEKGFEAAYDLMTSRQGNFYTSGIRRLTAEMQGEENNLLFQQQRQNNNSIVSFNRSFFVFLGCVFILLLVIFFSIRNNIAIRKKAEKQSKENKEQIENIFSAAPDAVIVIDDKGKIVKWNSMSEVLFGWTAGEVTGKPLTETIIPQRYHEAHREGLKRFLETGEGPVLGKTIEIQAINKKNIEFDVALSISPTTANAKQLFIGFVRDITKRKKAEEDLLKLSQELEQKVIERTKELAKSEKLFRAMIEKDADMKTLATADGKVFYASPSLTTILGYKNYEFRTISAFELIHPDDAPGLIEGISDIVQTPGKSFYRQQRLKHKNGTWIWCEGTITNMLHEPAVAALVSNFRDITERKQTVEALQENQQLLSAIINNSTAVIYVKDLQGHYLLVNQRFSELFHLSEEAILNKTDYDFFPQKEADAFRQMDIRTAAADHALTEEERVSQDDGMHTYISVKSTLRNASGKPYAIFGISTDITDRKKAEESIRLAEANYREIFDKASDAIYVHEIETGKVIEVNQRACEITGYSKEELINSDPQDFITTHPQFTLQHAFDYLQKAAEGKPQLFEWLGKNKDGSYNWLEVNLKKATIAGKKRILAFFRQINDRKKAQLEVQKLNEELEQKVIDRTAELQSANKEMESFTYSVSHDLRAPLRIIDGYADILVTDYENKLDEEGNRLLGIVKSNARRMGQLIDDLLNLSKIGKREPIIHLTDMNKLVKLVIDEELFLNGDSVTIKTGKLEPVHCDSGLLRQVWINFISNAVKYSSKKEKPVIEINSSKTVREMVYSVKDNGVGFDMKYTDKLFGVFQRLHSMEEFEGTGVGLALVHRIVSRHGGRVWVEAEVDKGATFYFSLPIIQTS